jgi:hypothetical protein
MLDTWVVETLLANVDRPEYKDYLGEAKLKEFTTRVVADIKAFLLFLYRRDPTTFAEWSQDQEPDNDPDLPLQEMLDLRGGGQVTVLLAMKEVLESNKLDWYDMRNALTTTKDVKHVEHLLRIEQIGMNSLYKSMVHPNLIRELWLVYESIIVLKLTTLAPIVKEYARFPQAQFTRYLTDAPPFWADRQLRKNLENYLILKDVDEDDEDFLDDPEVSDELL